MQSFEGVDAKSVEEAVALLCASESRAPVVAKAGGMDLLDLIKEGRSRTIALKDFLLPPDFGRDRDAVLARDEVLTHVSVPALSPHTRARRITSRPSATATTGQSAM